MSYKDLKAKLDQGKAVIIDGAIGTELERRGVEMDTFAWCGRANVHGFDQLVEVHCDYIRAGAEIITVNTYASNRIMLTAAGVGDQTVEINKLAVKAAQKARDKMNRPDVLIAGSVSHAVPIVPGTSTSDRSQMNRSEMFDAFGELAQIHKDEGCDLILLEMMFDPERVHLATKAAIQTGLPTWSGLSAKRGEQGEVLSFVQDEDVPFDALLDAALAYSVDAVGIMHTPSNVTSDAIPLVQARFNGVLTAYPDSGYFMAPHWQFMDIIPPTELVEFAKGWVKDGVQVLGGCCGLSPEHIEALSTEFGA